MTVYLFLKEICKKKVCFTLEKKDKGNFLLRKHVKKFTGEENVPQSQNSYSKYIEK